MWSKLPVEFVWTFPLAGDALPIETDVEVVLRGVLVCCSFFVVFQSLLVCWLMLQVSRKPRHECLPDFWFCLRGFWCWDPQGYLSDSEGHPFRQLIKQQLWGSFGLVDFIQTAGICFFAALFIVCLKIRSPEWTLVGWVLSWRRFSICWVNPHQLGLA